MAVSSVSRATRPLLLLAGTTEARALAHRLAYMPSWAAVASLAGTTALPAPYAIPTRRGGFGGSAGLRAWLAAHSCQAVIDATHPFATRIGTAAAEACDALGISLLRLDRPAWRPEPGDRWIEVRDSAAAAAALPRGAVAFLATGPGTLDTFADRPDIRFTLRTIDPPKAPSPPNGRVIMGRPPFSIEQEVQTLRATEATHLVCKNAGGWPGYAKLVAARSLGLPVVMIARPVRPCGLQTAFTVEDACAWLALHEAGAGLWRGSSADDIEPTRTGES
jgi:precorrin-6A/cobalt-precorrin-6A reductase